ncbi:TetR/AcrR family transcriptional regulator [Pseudooceanicola sp. CBS1P-1]|uniref:TetR/AcrR family transcriptional regulator n=1 Tax=Pseudooceanicola albus TaxID=2692189 RepID=A0A6L7FYM0_9RHOB|nr:MULTISPECIES: TetR/AcrR family transcriptional regulator [Pseudooceanicola]MBT9382339.1 TetR/AcrR family transcriptional regulator [Pseudooceanicola endophyticus]MXN16881.1 TetR/AcrR family transcriptional regulator [Pseudooceanicola albus]
MQVDDSNDLSPPNRKPGRPARISRDAIAGAALEIGLDVATVTSVAAQLGVDHSSLYRHVRGRDEIIAAAAELAVADLYWRRTEGDWRLFLEAMCDAVWDLYERHPGLADAIRSMEVMPVSGIRSFGEAVVQMQAYGFALPDAVLAVETLIDVTSDSFLGWRRITSGDAEGRPRVEVLAARWDQVAEEEPALAGALRHTAEVMRGEPRRWWLRKRALVLEGIAARLQP